MDVEMEIQFDVPAAADRNMLLTSFHTGLSTPEQENMLIRCIYNGEKLNDGVIFVRVERSSCGPLLPLESAIPN
jgi:hypothetical protein